MRVKYKGSVPQQVSGQGVESLDPQREYVVLEISTLPGRPSYFRIEVLSGDAPALFDVRLFEVTSPQIPSSWVASLQDDGLLTVGPLSWRTPGFWEAYLNRERWALKAYEQECRKVLTSTTD